MLLPAIVLSAALADAATRAPQSHLTMPVCQYPDTYQFSPAKCALEFRNDGDRPITISKLTPGSSRDSVAPSSLVIAPRSSAYAQATIVPAYEIGRVHRIFRFESDEAGQPSPKRVAEAVGFVSNVLDDPKPVLDFGVIKLDKQQEERAIRLESREVFPFRIEKILDAPSYVSARIGDDGQTIIARIRPDAPWGVHQSDYLKVSLNTPNQKEAWVAIHVDVHGEVVPNVNPVSLGLFRKGTKNEFTIRLTSRTGRSFRVGEIHSDGIIATSSVEPCVPIDDGCKLIRMRVSDEQPKGPIAAEVRVELPDFERVLPIRAWGMYVDKDTKVRNFNDEIKQSAQTSTTGQMSSVGPEAKFDVKKILEQKATESLTPPPGTGPLLKWSVAHEESIHGYAVYRSSSESGPFVRINEHIIRARGSGGDSSQYQWRDTSAIAGSTYWYYIGTILSSGSKEKLSSPQRVVAK